VGDIYVIRNKNPTNARLEFSMAKTLAPIVLELDKVMTPFAVPKTMCTLAFSVECGRVVWECVQGGVCVHIFIV
jgi:hypothetical protein